MNPKKTFKRLLSLDVFRGLTIALMILVNSPGNKVAYPWLEHSDWNGCTLADFVFPFFIVIVGVSSILALSNLRKMGLSDRQLFGIIVKRSAYIFLMGLVLNILPNHFDLTHLRILGVLQRIALCYFFTSLLFLTTKVRTQIAIITALLLGYCLVLFPGAFMAPETLSMDNNLVGTIDRLLLSPQHLYTPMFDPEGLLSTLPSLASALLGNLLGFCLLSSRTKEQQLQWMIITGIGLVFAGWFWGLVFPINKSLWSSSYVLWTSGWAYFIYALCFVLIEMKQWIRWSKPFVLFGKNAMLVYMLHVLFLKIQAIILVHNTRGEAMNLRHYITNTLFHSFSPENASLCYAISYTLFWLFVLTVLSKWRMRRQLVLS